MPNPYVAAVEPADGVSARAVTRLLPAGRILGNVLKGACPSGVKVTHRPTREGLVLITHSGQEFSEDERAAATTAVQREVDRRFGPGVFTAKGYTRDNLPVALTD